MDRKTELYVKQILKMTSKVIKMLFSVFQNRVKCPGLHKDFHFSDGGQAAGIINR